MVELEGDLAVSFDYSTPSDDMVSRLQSAVARITGNRGTRPWGPLLTLVALFLLYGLVLSQIVELAV